MKNTLTDLNNYMFEQLERLLDDTLSKEELEKEVERAKATTSVAQTIIQGGELMLRARKNCSEFGITPPKMLGGSND